MSPEPGVPMLSDPAREFPGTFLEGFTFPR